jgi:hypothetical protein
MTYHNIGLVLKDNKRYKPKNLTSNCLPSVTVDKFKLIIKKQLNIKPHRVLVYGNNHVFCLGFVWYSQIKPKAVQVSCYTDGIWSEYIDGSTSTFDDFDFSPKPLNSQGSQNFLRAFYFKRV